MKVNFITAMRKLAYPVSILSTKQRGLNFAITVSSVTSLSVEPPTLIACVNKASSFSQTLEVDALININYLATGQKEIASICSSREKSSQRFANGYWSFDDNETPFLKDSQAVVFCSIAQTLDYATHKIVILNVNNTFLSSVNDPDPLLYCDGEYRNL